MTRLMTVSVPLLLCFFISHAQITRLYFFKQAIMGGAQQETTKKTGTDLPSVSNTERFFLFAETKKGTTPLFSQLWINGKLFSFMPVAVKNLPVIVRTSPGGEMTFTDTLVKKAAGNIIQFTNVSLNPKQPGKAFIPQTARQHAVVIYYTVKRRKLFFKTDKTGQLHPLFTQ